MNELLGRKLFQLGWPGPLPIAALEEDPAIWLDGRNNKLALKCTHLSVMLESLHANDVISRLEGKSSNCILISGKERLSDLCASDALRVCRYVMPERLGESLLAVGGWLWQLMADC